MTSLAQDFWQDQADEPPARLDARVDPQSEDAYWQDMFRSQPDHRAELGWDDYAPAYCVGYIGQAQYGGRFADAEKCLAANWIRIKGDSRLTLGEALQAARAAWDHAAQGESEEVDGALLQMAMAGQRAQAANNGSYAAA